MLYDVRDHPEVTVRLLRNIVFWEIDSVAMCDRRCSFVPGECFLVESKPDSDGYYVAHSLDEIDIFHTSYFCVL